MIYKPFDIVVVPFPFVDFAEQKRRPAIIISSEDFSNSLNHSILAMITSVNNSTWEFDVNITDLKMAGLSHNSVIRFKLFTLYNKLIIKKIGHLSLKDRKIFCENFSKVFMNF